MSKFSEWLSEKAWDLVVNVSYYIWECALAAVIVTITLILMYFPGDSRKCLRYGTRQGLAYNYGIKAYIPTQVRTCVEFEESSDVE